jgi:hypothetical protein
MDLIPRPATREKKTDRVTAALETALEHGPLPSDDLKRQLEANLEEPLSEGTFAAAKRALGVVAWQADGRWVTGYEDDVRLTSGSGSKLAKENRV